MPSSPPLPPDGTAVFIDANILYYHFVRVADLSEWSSDLLQMAAEGRLFACTSAHAIAEAVHKVMAAEAAQRFSLARPAVVNYLRHHPERIGELTAFSDAAFEIAQLGLALLAADAQSSVDAAAISRAHGLLTNDALTVALMRRSGLIHLASNDEDFRRVSGLTVWMPR